MVFKLYGAVNTRHTVHPNMPWHIFAVVHGGWTRGQALGCILPTGPATPHAALLTSCAAVMATRSFSSQVRRVGLDNNLLEVSGTLEVFPRRSILLPATLLLPEVIPIRATLQIGVDGPLDTGAVELVVAKWVSTLLVACLGCFQQT